MKTKFNVKPNFKHVSTQTDIVVQKRISSPAPVISNKKVKNTAKPRDSSEIDVSVATLDEKIRRFQESFIKTDDEKDGRKDKNGFYQIPGIIQTPTRPPLTPTINLNDLLSQQKPTKQQFFAPATPNSVVSQTPSLPQIPATPTCLLTPASTCTNISLSRDPQDEIEQKIMQELSEMFGENDANSKEENFAVVSEQKIEENETNTRNEDESGENSPIIDLRTLSQMKDPEQREKEMREKLMSSIWPCELHYQKMRLRTVLSDIADRNFRKYEKVQCFSLILSL